MLRIVAAISLIKHKLSMKIIIKKRHKQEVRLPSSKHGKNKTKESF